MGELFVLDAHRQKIYLATMHNENKKPDAANPFEFTTPGEIAVLPDDIFDTKIPEPLNDNPGLKNSITWQLFCNLIRILRFR
jgi:hypothetical protein